MPKEQEQASDSDSSDPYRDIRPSSIAGRWYSDSPQKLSKEIDRYLDAALPPLSGRVLAVVAPHAGYMYSGPTAGCAFAAVKEQAFKRVVVLSPLHAWHPADVLTSGHSAYETPLGRVPVDTTVLDTLQTRLLAEGVSLPRLRYDQEHSLEIELPFLQRALPGGFTLAPLMIRSQEADVLQKIAGAVFETLIDGQTLLVASTDLSHFFPQNQAHVLDSYLLNQIEKLSPQGVLTADREGKGMACGVGAVAVTLWTALRMGADGAKILHQTTSAEITDDLSSVVGYGSVVILKKA